MCITAHYHTVFQVESTIKRHWVNLQKQQSACELGQDASPSVSSTEYRVCHGIWYIMICHGVWYGVRYSVCCMLYGMLYIMVCGMVYGMVCSTVYGVCILWYVMACGI